MTDRQLFQQHIAQTSGSPVGIEIAAAAGNYLYDVTGKKYLDLIGGISVCNIGHCHPQVVQAIKEQADKYLHVMVYGELIQSPQVQYATLLAAHLPPSLQCVYFTNSGTEATEGAIKLARRVTGRANIISCHQAYHGSTTGALSVMGDEYWRNAFRPLMPGVQRYSFNSAELINSINSDTAAVIIETVQAEAGVIAPHPAWLASLREACTKHNTLLIMDEIQCGFGRTGRLWGFQHYNVVPDIVLLGKALGGGLPLGAFIASRHLMDHFTTLPVLGHITTFGGHPLCCAAGIAAMGVLLQSGLIDQVEEKAQMFVQGLQLCSRIRKIRTAGLLIAVELADNAAVTAVLQQCLQKGIFSDWFLFAPHCIRIAPPLTITEDEIAHACTVLRECIEGTTVRP